MNRGCCSAARSLETEANAAHLAAAAPICQQKMRVSGGGQVLSRPAMATPTSYWVAMTVASSTGGPNTGTMTIVTGSAPSQRVEEAMAAADTALALAGYEVPQFVRDLEARIARGEITPDDAVAQIIARHTGADRQQRA